MRANGTECRLDIRRSRFLFPAAALLALATRAGVELGVDCFCFHHETKMPQLILERSPTVVRHFSFLAPAGTPLSKGSTGFLCLQNRERRLEHGVGIQGNTVDSLLHEKLRKFRIIARRLTSNSDFASALPADPDHLCDHLFHGLVSLVKDRRHNFAIE